MGCDIHAFIERRKQERIAAGEAWEFVLSDRGEPYWGGRNYARFSVLAGVRAAGHEKPGGLPKGLPENISSHVRAEYDSWGGDGHSHSWHEFWEALTIWMETDYEMQPGSGPHSLAGATPEVQAWQIFGHVPEPGYDYRIVYWFDN